MDHEIRIKLALALLAIPVVLWLDRPGRRFSPRRAGSWLVLAAAVATAAYYNFGGFHGWSYVHHWEQFHYFLGSKYYPELGHDGLYVASLVAQQESRPQLPLQDAVRDLTSNEVVPLHVALQRAAEVRGRFGERRWQRFRRDNDHFLATVNLDYLRRIRLDHGYNPSPTWTFVARLATAWLPARHATLVAVGWLDPLLLAAAFVLLFRTYGSRVGCLCLLVFGLGYPWRFDWIGGAVLRLDWLAAVIAATCLLRRGAPLGAGALVAYAGMVRVFPFALLFGPLVLAVRALVRRQGLAASWRLAQGVVLGIALGLAAGTLAGRGPRAWSDFAANLEKHHGTWLTNNVGLENLVLYGPQTMRRELVDWSLAEPWTHWQAKMDRWHEERRPYTLLLAAAFLALAAAAAWRAPPEEALLLGMIAVFALLLLTCYYWIMLLLVPLRGDRVAAAALLALQAGLFALHLATPSFEAIYGLFSWVLALGAIAWAGPAALATLRARAAGGVQAAAP